MIMPNLLEKNKTTRYRGDIVAGSLLIAESRTVAELLMREIVKNTGSKKARSVSPRKQKVRRNCVMVETNESGLQRPIRYLMLNLVKFSDIYKFFCPC